MNKMNKKITFVLAFLLILSGFVSAEICGVQNLESVGDCVPQIYDSCYLCMNTNVDSSTGLSTYITQLSGDAAYHEPMTNTVCGPNSYYIDSNTGVLKLKTPSLPFTGTYTLRFYYGIGTPNDIGTEDFTVKCGGDTFYFMDNDDVGSEVEFRFGEVECEFNSGYNYVEFKSIDTGSVHFKKFKITGELTCPETEPFCPLNPEEYDEIITINKALRSDTTNLNAKTPMFPVSLDAGKYAVTLVARDNYTERVSAIQPNEQYQLSFIKNGEEVGITPSTSDLQDSVAFAQVNELVTSNLILPNGADNIQGIHTMFNFIPTSSPNSLTAVCIGINKISGPDPYCGDGVCNGLENCSTCPSDCGVCPEPDPYCGDGVCNGLENCKNCVCDCGECPEEEDDECDECKEVILIDDCESNWKCSGWSECYEGIMTRECVDKNHCENQYNMPLEISACTSILSAKVEDEKTCKYWWIWIIVAIVLLIILIRLLR